MASAVVYEGIERGVGGEDGGSGADKLFSGLKLWFSYGVPTREWLKDNAVRNGAEIVDLEKQADILLVDHARKNQPPGTHSYRWLELSIRRGRREDLADHAVGAPSRADRPVGSVVTASRGGRNHYTEEEDQFLYNMMRPFVDRGGSWKGLEIYKQIERIRPRHTYQSWRDHWIKITQFQKRQVTENIEIDQYEAPSPQQRAKVPSTPSRKRTADQMVGPEEGRAQTSPARTPLRRLHVDVVDARDAGHAPGSAQSKVSRTSKTNAESSSVRPESPLRTPEAERNDDSLDKPPVKIPDSLPGNFTRSDFRGLYKATNSILNLEPAERDQRWSDVAGDKKFGGHSKAQWKEFWQLVVLPVFCKRQGKTLAEVAPELVASGGASSITQNSAVDHLGKGSGASQAEPNPGLRSCFNCFTTESDKWRYDTAGKPLCNECGRFLKQYGALRPSNTWTDAPDEDETGEEQPPAPAQTASDLARIIQAPISTPGRVDVGVQTSPLIEPRESEQRRAKSLSVEPDSPSLSRPPEPNEARKRSVGKSSQSNSQDSKASKESEKGRSGDSARPESPQMPPRQLSPEKRRKRPQLQDEPSNLEIPSTPEGHSSQIGAFEHMVEGEEGTHHHPSPGPEQRRNRDTTPIPYSPLFVSEDDNDSDEDDEAAEEEEPATPAHKTSSIGGFDTSPLRIDLVGEANSSQHGPDDDISDAASTISSAYHFDTAPDMSENWETAPETPREHSGDRIETQALFERYDHPSIGVGGEDFDLPAPQGGWEIIDLVSPSSPPPLPRSPTHDDAAAAAAEGNEDDSSSQATDIDSWITAQSALYSSIPEIELDAILHAAIEAASFDFAIGAAVVREILRSQASRSSKANGGSDGNVQLPQRMRGCWTAEDDNLLFSQNARDVERVEKKHGPESCNRRFDFLELWMAD